MRYVKVKLGSEVCWSASPMTWRELGETLANETLFIPYDPNNIEIDEELIKMFE